MLSIIPDMTSMFEPVHYGAQGFSVFVMLAELRPARKGREVPATPRRGVAGTSLPLPSAPLGARAQSGGEENGKALLWRASEAAQIIASAPGLSVIVGEVID